MKNMVICIFLIILVSSFANAKQVSIPELFEIENQIVSESMGKEVYFYANSKLIAVNEEYKYQDRLGSDIESKSLPFGQPLEIENRYSFTGKELDKDLVYFGARYYDPNLGRFTSVDPVKENHAYIYVENDPMNLIDPDGRDDNGLMQEYEIDQGSINDFVTSYFPDRISEEDRMKLGESIFNAFEEGANDAQKNIISQLTPEELDKLGFSEGLPRVILHFTFGDGDGNFAHAGIWSEEKNDEKVFHIRISSESIPAMFIKGDIFRHEGDLPLRKNDARIVRKAAALAIGVIYGEKPSLSFWENQKYGWQIGYSKDRGSQKGWFADLTTIFYRMHPGAMND